MRILTTSPDGACLETIMQAAVAVKKDEENSMKEFGKTDDIGRYGKISFDAHVVRGKFAFCYHTGEFKGVSTDAFDLDIIVNEYKRLEALEAEEDKMMAGAPSEGNGDAVDTKEAEKEDEDDEEEMKGRHYLVMRFQTWSGKSTPINFNAAKYCLKSPNSRWLRRNIRKIVAILATFGFYVTGYAFDGATENRSFIKHTMDMTLGDVLPHLLKAPTTAHADGSHLAIAPSAELPADPVIQQASSSGTTANEVTANMEESPKALDNTKRQFTRDQIPFDMVVAHMHPVVKDLLIAALGDMSHAAKKQCNALEKGYLQLDGKPMSLKMLYDCWEHCPDSSGRVGKVMHFPGITREVFVKDAKNRMRVPLAVKAQSNSMVKIIQTYGRSNAQKCNMETYDSLIEHCTKTNRWVDVMNNSRDKGCEQIDDPDHPHCYELLGYVEYHHRWMLQARGKKCGVPKSTYEDVVWTCIGVVITAHQLLNKFPFALDGTKNRIHQRLHGSDDCEMLFAMSRGKNANADAKLTDNNISGSLGTNVMNQLAASSKTNCGKVNTIPSKNLDVQKTKRQKLYNTH
uniref:Uncharacterized protein n=1 Tax=Skeletonema marinoi TaxID=267567 RepID=A0A7S2LHX1_9STRA|mmetsp:Transcript_25525/g.43333  ORF Transcript_25525/g.43333 Transcript_25525/m.43333 type:complete len:571 (+) Transcript_25525:3-1715(+)